MRGVLIALVAVATPASANPLQHHDPEVLRPDLETMTVTNYEMRNGKRVAIGREVRAYDTRGQVKWVEHRRGGKLVNRTTYTWTNGRLTKRAYREPSGRVEIRELSYKVDAHGRVVEMTLRDPKAANGEKYVTTTTWKPDGSRSEITERHYKNEGPYEDSSKSYDAKGRLDTHCWGDGNCEMASHDQHGMVVRVRQQMGADHAYMDFDATYDANDRLIKYGAGPSAITLTYDANGNVDTETRPARGNGATAVYTYVRR